MDRGLPLPTLPLPTQPLPTLLSHALVAFTIEFDNEFERQTPHRTTDRGFSHGSPHAPWLVAPWLISMAMWTIFLRFVPEEGVDVAELRHVTGMPPKNLDAWLARLGKWWGYISVESKRVRLTPGGRRAVANWRPLSALIERRWETRFGQGQGSRLKESLERVAAQLPPDLPDQLPILGYGLFSTPNRRTDAAPDDSTLPSLLSKVLLAFAVEFEQSSGLSLAVSANVLRLLDGDGVRVRDLPRLSGISKEAIAVALGLLEKSGCAVSRSESAGSRVKVAALTPKGQRAQVAYRQQLTIIEDAWNARFGKKAVAALRESLAALDGSPALNPEPYADGWRASVARTEVLPDYPMITHRGGFPDGS